MVIFRRVHDEFVQKCRENKLVRVCSALYHPLKFTFQRYLVREFHFSEESLLKEREDLVTADTTEKELWVCPFSVLSPHQKLINSTKTELLRLSRTNFSESFQILVHLKVVRLYIESVLRYGLPANYIGLAIKVRSHIHIPERSNSIPSA